MTELATSILEVLTAAGEPLSAAAIAERLPGVAGEAVAAALAGELAGAVREVPERGYEVVPPAPKCPRCGAELEIRKWRKPPRSGKLFWGCSRYREKKCGYTRDLLRGEKPPPRPEAKRNVKRSE